ncbi:hypothetical protein [Crassaminicella profunda]|uniref:hypothetical protein n=1 Tax=Crassaminicella profunda TaxID=1286698 RepID=UPI001CA72F72|nr:hypothetical protein [Crassaminicella profunda]QZY56644.1 hypothetical protein K7H06_06915 [Crassaminicella profunda]
MSFVVNPGRLNTELGLVSTITSIILSVIAIIYTLVDSSNNKKTSEKIIDASNTITTVTKDIEGSSSKLSALIEDLSTLDLLNKLSNIEQSVKCVDESVATVDTKFGNHIAELKNALFSSIHNENTENTKNHSEHIKTAMFLCNNLQEIYNAKRLLYLVGLSKINKDINYMHVINFAINTMNTSNLTEPYNNPLFLEGILSTVLGLFSHLGFYYWDENFRFQNVFDGVQEVNKWIEENDKEFANLAKSEFLK